LARPSLNSWEGEYFKFGRGSSFQYSNSLLWGGGEGHTLFTVWERSLRKKSEWKEEHLFQGGRGGRDVSSIKWVVPGKPQSEEVNKKGVCQTKGPIRGEGKNPSSPEKGLLGGTTGSRRRIGPYNP